MNEITGITTLFISVGLSIVVGLLTNLMTPIVQDWINKRSVSTRGKTLARLKEDYERIKRWHDTPAVLLVDIAPLIVITIALILFLLLLFMAISGQILAVVLSTVPLQQAPTNYRQFLLTWKSINIGLGILGIITMVSFIRLSAYLFDIFRLRNFEKYEKTILARINELERASTPKAS